MHLFFVLHLSHPQLHFPFLELNIDLISIKTAKITIIDVITISIICSTSNLKILYHKYNICITKLPTLKIKNDTTHATTN